MYIFCISTWVQVELLSHNDFYVQDNNLYRKKPKSITSWFSTNVVIEKDDIEVIPLGVNNDYMHMYPTVKDFTNNKFNSLSDKNKYLYINFNTNTRFLQRFHAKVFFKNKQYVIFDENNLLKNDYLKNVNNTKFVFCPWGNGFDTHRLWETIYSNSIPVVISHKAYESFKDLPIVFLKKLRDFDIEKIIIENQNPNLSGTIADFEYWKDRILSQKINDEETTNILFDLKKKNEKFVTYFNILRVIKNRYKRIRYFFFRIYKYIVKLLI